MDNFLAQTDWAEATLLPLAGDASTRRYYRAQMGDETAILMDVGPNERGQLVKFETIAQHLTDHHLSAPNILASDHERYLLIEDFGDALYPKVVADDPGMETDLYARAIDAIRAIPPLENLKPYGPREMVPAVDLLFDWYHPLGNGIAESGDRFSDLKESLQDLLNTYLTNAPVFIHRDFHAENLIWLPDRDGHAAVGLLDFQDAVLGDPTYDIASLLNDARRDVSAEVRNKTISHFLESSGMMKSKFEVCFALCTVQRNMRIMGIFAKLCIEAGKTQYTELLPRVWRDLRLALEHPSLNGFKLLFLSNIPEPTAKIIARIRDHHG